MKTVTPEQLKQILEQHKLWLRGEGGEQANLSEANLSEANLRWANLRWANLSEANLRWADLRWANLSEANLRWADLHGADLSEADLSEANLREADLHGADLSEAVARLDFGGWSICVRNDSTSIGCRTYANEKWLSWSPDDVAAFDVRAKEWWQTHGDAVKAVIRCVMAKHAAMQPAPEKTTSVTAVQADSGQVGETEFTRGTAAPFIEPTNGGESDVDKSARRTNSCGPR